MCEANVYVVSTDSDEEKLLMESVDIIDSV